MEGQAKYDYSIQLFQLTFLSLHSLIFPQHLKFMMNFIAHSAEAGSFQNPSKKGELLK